MALTVVQTFVSGGEQEMTQLVRLHQEMKHEYERAARFFGEDPSKIRVDEFYGAFAGFVTDFEVEMLLKHAFVHVPSP